MAKYYIINTVTVNLGNASQRLLPGTLVDDSTVDVTALQAAGAILVSSTNTTVAAAAANATNARNRGANEATLEGIMASAYSSSTDTFAQAHDTVGSTSLVQQTNLGAVPAKGVAVHAQAAAGAPLNLVSGFTLPFPRRSLQVVLGTSGADPVNVTVTGTAPGGAAQVLSQALHGASTTELGNGAQCWESITSVTTDVNPGGTFDLQTGTGISVGQPVVDLDTLSSDGVAEAIAAKHVGSGGFKTTTAPNGTHQFAVRYTVAHTHGLS